MTITDQIVRWKSALLMLVLLITAGGCSPGEALSEPDLDQQLAEDLQIIDSYVEQRGFSNVQTTRTGARYVIVETGEGEPIGKGDIFSLNYLGKTDAGIVFNTNIPAVLDSAVSVPSSAEGEPFVMTYSETGWTFNAFLRLAGLETSNLSLRGEGLKDAMAEALGEVRTGAKIVVMLPSEEGFGPAQTQWIDPYSVLIFELYPVEIL